MLPASYQLPAAIVLLLGGIVACFFGYRLFRIVLAIFGFILGALAASSVFGASDTGPMLVAAAVGGLVGAGMLIAAYFVGVALVGAALGAVVANLAFSASGREPHFLVVAFCAVAGAVGSMYLQRYFIIVGTGVRRGVDDDRRRDGAGRRSHGAGRGGRGRRLGAVSAESGAGPGVGADCVGRAGADWHGRAAGLDRRREGPGRSPGEES